MTLIVIRVDRASSLMLHDSVRHESDCDSDSDSDSSSAPARIAAPAPMSNVGGSSCWDFFDALNIDEMQHGLYQEAERGMEPLSWESFQDPGATGLPLAELIVEPVREGPEVCAGVPGKAASGASCQPSDGPGGLSEGEINLPNSRWSAAPSSSSQ